MQEVSRRRTSEGKYHAVEGTGYVFRFSEDNARSSRFIHDFFDIRAAEDFNLTSLFHAPKRIVVLLIESGEICLSICKRDAITLWAKILYVFGSCIPAPNNQHRLILNVLRRHIKKQAVL